MNPSILTKAIDSTVHNTVRRHQQETELNTLLPLAAKLLEPLLAGVDVGDPFDNWASNTYLELYPLPGREVVLTLGVYELESLKDPRLTQILEAFLAWGDPKVSEADWTTTPDRIFTFRKKFEAENLTLTARIRGAVGKNSPTCRKVQVGVKTVETPVFEVVCE